MLLLELLDVAEDALEPMPELLVPEEVPLVAVDDDDSDEGLATEQDDGEQDVIDEADDDDRELWLAV